MELQKVIRGRHSVRKYNTTKPDWRDVIEVIDSARFAPMAGNNYTLKFILVSDPEKIEKLSEMCQQQFIKQTHHVLIVCSSPSRLINEFGQAGKIYARQQAGAGIQNILLSLTEKGLSTCWIGFFVERQIKRLLKIPNEVDVEALLPIGYEFQKPTTKKAKIDLDSALYFDEYKNKQMKKPPKLSA